MNKSPTHSRCESADHCRYEFDYHEDFTQFLEEARKNSFKFETSSAHHPRAARKEQIDGERSKKRRSWKNSLFSWLKKAKSAKQPMNDNPVSRPRRGHVSGPVQVTCGGIGRARRAASGPLVGHFSASRRVEDYELPYVCLAQLNDSQKLPSYGPLYLVT